VQELALRVTHVTETLTGELGRAPTPAELAQRCDASIELVLEAMGTVTAHRADSLDQPRYDDDEDTAAVLGGANDPGYARIEDEAEVEQLLEVLPDRERIILEWRFRHGLTQSEIGERLGLSQMHVSRLIRSTISELQAAHTRSRAGRAG
jgi:RNA polymerase sigma-B factor